MAKKELLRNEQIERTLSPHPLSFMKLQTLSIFIIIWGLVVWWLTSYSEYERIFSVETWYYSIILWGLVLLFIGIVASLIAIQWMIFFLYLSVFAGSLGLIFSQQWQNYIDLFIPLYSIAISIVGFLIVELYRRSHKYIITDMRIIFKGGIFTKRERTIRYDKIADVDAKQGILGQIFGFGTIIPVSQSGFGLGSDKTFAAGGVEMGTQKTRFFGLAGGGKEVQTPIARSYYELHGVYPYKEVKQLVENLLQNHVPTQYQKEQIEFEKQQVDIQKQMRDLLHKQISDKPRKKAVKQALNEEPDEEETEGQKIPIKKSLMIDDAYQPEQIDIQQQMKELLRKQKTSKVIDTEEEIEDTNEEDEEKEDV